MKVTRLHMEFVLIFLTAQDETNWEEQAQQQLLTIASLIALHRKEY